MSDETLELQISLCLVQQQLLIAQHNLLDYKLAELRQKKEILEKQKKEAPKVKK